LTTDKSGNVMLDVQSVLSLMMYEMDFTEVSNGFVYTDTWDVGLTFDGREFGHFHSTIAVLTNLTYGRKKRKIPQPWELLMLNRKEDEQAYDEVRQLTYSF
jgi:hypothetical protein